MDRRLLEHQADRLQAALTVHNAPGRVVGGTVTPRWVRFQVLPVPGVKVDRVRALSEDLARALAVENVRVARRGAALAIEVPRDDPQPVRLLQLLRQLKLTDSDQQIPPEIPPATACLGLAEDGTPLLIWLPSPDVAHILVAGTTGSGKTALLRAMTLSLALNHRSSELALVLIDPRDGKAFDHFAGLPHLVRPVIRDTDESVEVLTSLLRLMEQRDRDRVVAPTVVLFIDELTDLLMVGGKAVQWALTRLTQRGRGAGIHVIAATQKPTAAVLGPLVKANFPVRIVGRVTSTEDAKVASGWRGTGAERLMGRGDFLAIAEGRVTRFQAAFVSEQEIAEELAARGWDYTPPSPMLQPDPPARAAAIDVVTLPDPPPPDPDPVDVLAGRLAEMGWDPSQSYLSACRALGQPEGGRPFYRVKEAVDQLRQGGESTTTTTLPQKETENGQRADIGVSLSGSGSSGSNAWADLIQEWEAENGG